MNTKSMINSGLGQVINNNIGGVMGV